MLKMTALVLVLSHFSLPGMEADDSFAPFKWRSCRLERLLEESKHQTCNQWNQEVRLLKATFVQKYLEKYRDQQAILNDLARETGGVIRATTDPELARKDSNKFLCIDPLKYTADEIDARWQLIHHVDCKNMRSKKYDTDWQAIGDGSGGIVSVGTSPDTNGKLNA